MIDLNSLLLLGAALFCIGLFGVLSKWNAALLAAMAGAIALAQES